LISHFKDCWFKSCTYQFLTTSKSSWASSNYTYLLSRFKYSFIFRINYNDSSKHL